VGVQAPASGVGGRKGGRGDPQIQSNRWLASRFLSSNRTQFQETLEKNRLFFFQGAKDIQPEADMSFSHRLASLYENR